MAMNLHTDRVDRSIGTSDNFGKIWAWTAGLVFLAVMLGGWDNRLIDSNGLVGWLTWTAMAGFAAVFPGVMIAALVKGLCDILES